MSIGRPLVHYNLYAAYIITSQDIYQYYVHII